MVFSIVDVISSNKLLNTESSLRVWLQSDDSLEQKGSVNSTKSSIIIKRLGKQTVGAIHIISDTFLAPLPHLIFHLKKIPFKSFTLKIVSLEAWGQFHHHFMSSFCASRFTPNLLAYGAERTA